MANWLFFAFLFLACDPAVEDDTGDSGGGGDTDSMEDSGTVDFDADGYAAGVDCDDSDATVHPGADEFCNDTDDDCDGELDEDALDAALWHADVDEDGFGDVNRAVAACVQPEGMVSDATDCDDARDDVHPDMAELCNSRDDDCDGSSDVDAADAGVWYADGDSDGFGDVNQAVTACVQPAGMVADAADCDDARDDVHPDVPEVCNSRDDDCDGSSDVDAVDAGVWYADDDSDGFGDPNQPHAGCVQPPNTVLDSTDCDDSLGDVHPGVAEVCNTRDDDCDGTSDQQATDAASWFTDADTDGFGDLNAEVLACVQPANAVADSSDCDDGRDDVFPGAAETCDDVDHDCDGDAYINAVDATFWYSDADTDGFGDPAASALACLAPPNFVADATDCDDLAILVFPGAIEVCNTIDDNCDAVVDTDATDKNTYFVDADRDSFGTAATTLACTLPVAHAFVSGDCDDGNNLSYPGAPELCDLLDNDCNTAVDDGVVIQNWYLDSDTDGFGLLGDVVSDCAPQVGRVLNFTDCDDGDIAIFPGQVEVCDGVDNDCNTLPDDGLVFQSWYADGDGDTFGRLNDVISSCALVEAGRVLDSTDCDDGDSTSYVGATELCDAVDHDCDGDLILNASDTTQWYADIDRDTFGDPAVEASACVAPALYVADNTDCDDGNLGIYPGNTELCDGVDENCDNAIDENATDRQVFYLDSDTDTYGDPAAPSALECTAPLNHVIDNTDCDDAVWGVNPAATEVCDGGDVDEDCSGAADDADPGVTGRSTWYVDGDSDNYGADGSAFLACDPGSAVAVDGDCDDGAIGVNPGAVELCGNGVDDNCADGVDEGCPIDHCVPPTTISVDTTWAAGQVHQVACDVYVEGAGNPLLTIEPGATVEFINGSLLVGFSAAGGLDAQGVTFTSGESTPAPDDWKGLLFNDFTDTVRTDLSGSLVEYAGASNARVRHAGITVWNTDVVLNSVTIQNTDGNGIWARGAPTITNSNVNDSTLVGVQFDTTGPTDFSGNSLANNGGYAVSIRSTEAGGFGPGNTAFGNLADAIHLRDQIITTSTTWANAGMPYLVTWDMNVRGAGPVTLTIEDGAEVQFATNQSLSIGRSAIPGALWIDGSVNGVVFTSAAATPAAGDWDGLTLEGPFDMSASRLVGLEVAYGGAAGFAGIRDRDGNIVISGCNVHDNSGIGLDTRNGTASVDSCFFENNGDEGVYSQTTTFTSFDNNTLQGNGAHGLTVDASTVGDLGVSNVFAGNFDDRIKIRNGYISGNQTWVDLGVPLHITADLSTAAGLILQIQDGVRMEFDPNIEFNVSGGFGNEAILMINASVTPVVMTSAAASPAPGDWDGLRFWTYSGSSLIDGLVVDYAGQTVNGGLRLNASVYVRNTVVRYSASAGLYVSGAARPDIADSVFSDNVTDGVYFVPGTYPALGTNFNGVFMDNNGGAALTVCIAAFDQLGPTLGMSGNGVNEIVITDCGGTPTLGATVIHDVGIPYLMTTPVRVTTGSSTLYVDIERGVTFLQEPNTYWQLGFANYGTIRTVGSGAAVTWTSSAASPAAGDWWGLITTSWTNTMSTDLENVVIEYAGGGAHQGGFESHSTGVSITNSVLQHNLGFGVWATGVPQGPEVSGTAFINNASGDKNY